MSTTTFRSRNTRRLVSLASILPWTILLAGSPAAADPYDSFSEFASGAFGAEREPLVYEWFGGILDLPRDPWEYVSEKSAAIGFISNLPARSRVEYGRGTDLDRSTEPTDRFYSVHLHHLTGLTPGVQYTYRIVMVDERGNEVHGPPRTIVPATPHRCVRIPSDLPGPPFVLDRPDTHYLLEADVETDEIAFEIQADGITLDLGGHTVTYDTHRRQLEGDWPVYRKEAGFGVRSLGPDGFRVLNGTIVQGEGRSGAHPHESLGFNPLLVEEGENFEIAGLVLEYSGSQMVGLFARYPSGVNVVHHNVFLDRGHEIVNRHGVGSKSMAVIGDVTTFHTHHNLVKRTRQSGLDGVRIEYNEIYIDSYATNSYGVPALEDDREAHHNRIFGTGYHVVGLGWGRNNYWHDNFIHLVGQGPDSRYPEYGNQESLNGIRLTQYHGATVDYSNSVVEHNLVVITGGRCSAEGACTKARGLQYFSDPHVVDNVIRDNTIKVVMNAEVEHAAAVVTQGRFDLCGTEAPVRYEGNRLIANITNVRLGDSYGQGCNHVFVNNEMVRVGDRRDYRTFRFDYPADVVDQFMFDTRYSDGASADLIRFTQPGQEIRFGWSLTVGVTTDGQPVEGVEVMVRDVEGTPVAEGRTDDRGNFSHLVEAYRERSGGRRVATPTEVVVTSQGQRISRWVKMDGPVKIDLDLVGATGGGQGLDLVAESASGNTEFRWSGALGQQGRLSIYDLAGQLVADLEAPAGAGTIGWNEANDRGAPVAPGLYYAELQSGELSAVCPVVVAE